MSDIKTASDPSQLVTLELMRTIQMDGERRERQTEKNFDAITGRFDTMAAAITEYQRENMAAIAEVRGELNTGLAKTQRDLASLEADVNSLKSTRLKQAGASEAEQHFRDRNWGGADRLMRWAPWAVSAVMAVSLLFGKAIAAWFMTVATPQGQPVYLCPGEDGQFVPCQTLMRQ